MNYIRTQTLHKSQAKKLKNIGFIIIVNKFESRKQYDMPYWADIYDIYVKGE